MGQSLQSLADRLRSSPSAPLALLAVVSVLSLGARLAWLNDPCRSPCTTAADHTLVFDETYYVNAARVIAGLNPPSGAPYAGAPAGDDPNSEHPQLAKLVIAASIELFGDGPFAWRLGSVLLGSLAILGMFALVRAAGGGRWPALAASALMASDNRLLVHGRIGTLDIYVLAAMLWGVALYLRGRPLWAGVVLGVGSCVKLVAPYALVVVALLTLGAGSRLAGPATGCELAR
jgi:4-amino-4-deoxy-L-arabinose transferase-like glycosyltransferase